MECSICMDPTDIIQGHKHKYAPKGSCGVVLRCSHVFHRKCIKKWYSRTYEGNTCPCCRGKVRFQESSLYNRLIIDFEYLLPLFCPNTVPESLQDLHDGFLYYDNAALQLFVCQVLINRTHFCFYLLKKKPPSLNQ
jgi:hypothetical protein